MTEVHSTLGSFTATVLFGLLAGFLIADWSGSGDVARDAPATRPTPDDFLIEPDGSLRTARTATAPEQSPVDDRVETDDTTGSDPAPPRVERESPWSNTLEGRVLDADQMPVADVEIRALASGVRTLVTRTDADGRFRLDDLPDARWKLSATHPSHRVAVQGPAEQFTGQFVHFLAHPVFDVDFDIVAPDGSTPDHVVLSIRELTFHHEETWTPTNRRVRIPAYGAQVRALALPIEELAWSRSRLYRWRSEVDWVSRHALRSSPEEVPRVRLELEVVPAILFELAPGSVLPGNMQIRLSRLTEDGETSASNAFGPAQGPWVSYDLDPGSYLATPSWAGASRGAPFGPVERIELGTELLRTEVRIDGLPTSDWIRLDITDSRGERAYVDRLRLRSGHGRSSTTQNAHRILDFDGAQYLPRSELQVFLPPPGTPVFGVDVAELRQRSIEVIADHPSLGTGRALIDGGVSSSQSEIRIVLEALGRLELTPSPWPEGINRSMPLRIKVYQRSLIDEMSREDLVASADGRGPGPIVLDRVPAGPLRVEVLARAGERRPLPFVSLEMSRGSLHDARVVTLPETHRLSVECPNLAPGSELLAFSRRTEGAGNQVLAGRTRARDGAAMFTGLEAGDYEIRVSDTGATLSVTVPSDPIRIE